MGAANEKRRFPFASALSARHRALKEYKLAPSAEQAQLLRARFDRIFKRASTGHATLDRLLRRCFETRTGSRAFSNARKFRSTPTLPKTISAPSSRKEKSPAEPLATTGPTRATSCGAGQNLHEIEIVVLRLHQRPPRHPRPQHSAPRKPHPPSAGINPTSLARIFAPVTSPSLLSKYLSLSSHHGRKRGS